MDRGACGKEASEVSEYGTDGVVKGSIERGPGLTWLKLGTAFEVAVCFDVVDGQVDIEVMPHFMADGNLWLDREQMTALVVFLTEAIGEKL